jgi:D-glycero-D-manno-heptose 1,7-bisphosphate phosphatase
MIVAAGERMKLDLRHSWVVGNRASDIAAGRAARLEGGILILPGEDDAERNAAAALKTEGFAVENTASLDQAVSLLLAQKRLG